MNVLYDTPRDINLSPEGVTPQSEACVASPLVRECPEIRSSGAPYIVMATMYMYTKEHNIPCNEIYIILIM